MRRLQPLRIPGGWKVLYNSWVECDPEDSRADDDLVEDLFQAYHEGTDILVDVGWYGSVEEGAFGAVRLRHDFHGEELENFRSRSRREVVEVVERWLRDPLG